MYFSYNLIWIFYINVLMIRAYEFGSTKGTDELAAKGLKKLRTYMSRYPSECSIENAAVRKEWSDLSPERRIEYINAVLCLQSKPAISGLLVPGARSRFDDLGGTHINQSLTIHNTGNFLSWHRYYIWTYEKALREECGYKGYLPYWNWSKYAHDPLNSPLFDGSNSSISGDGSYRKHPAVKFKGQPPGNCKGCSGPVYTMPPSNGGGCINSGPFKDMVVNLGPVANILPYIKPNPRKDGLGYNPRCVRRDISKFISSSSTTDYNSTELITKSYTIHSFQGVMEGIFGGKPDGFGVHGGGHFTVGGDPGGDFYCSSFDPYFFLHHAQVDRMWWIWQNQDVGNRYYVIDGTRTMLNKPPSPNATLDDLMDLGVNAGPIKLRTAMVTTSGPFCYIYK